MQIREMGGLYVMLGGGVSTRSREIVVAVEKWGHFEHLGRMLRSVGWRVGQSTFGVGGGGPTTVGGCMPNPRSREIHMRSREIGTDLDLWAPQGR